MYLFYSELWRWETIKWKLIDLLRKTAFIDSVRVGAEFISVCLNATNNKRQCNISCIRNCDNGKL